MNTNTTNIDIVKILQKIDFQLGVTLKDGTFITSITDGKKHRGSN